MERAGFVARQILRSRRHPQWNEYNRKTKLVGEALLILPYLAVLLVGIGVIAESIFKS